MSKQYDHCNHTSAEEYQHEGSECFSDDFRNERVTHGKKCIIAPTEFVIG